MPRPSLALLFVTVFASIARAEAPADDARAIAVKVTNIGAALFDARDARGLALTYAEDARLEILARDKDTGELKTETKVGRTEIEAYYEQTFKSDGAIHARNTVEHARFLDPDLLLISGYFQPNTESTDSAKLPFSQLRDRKNGEWRIVNLQLFVFFPK